jgi:hypothetical protein
MGARNLSQANELISPDFDDYHREENAESLRSGGEVELRYRQLVEHAPDAYIVSDPLTTRILDVNEAACNSLGYLRWELLRLSIPDISPDLDRTKIRRIWNEVRKGEPSSFETTRRRKDGSTFPVEIRLGVTGSGRRQLMLGLARDITERKLAETALRASEERYRNLVEHAPDAFFVVNPNDGSILDINELACRWLGYTRAELLNLNVTDLDKSAGLSGLKAMWSDVQLGNVKLLESMTIRGDGSEFPVELRAGRTDYGGRPAMLVLVRDITDLKRQHVITEQLEQKAVVARELHLQNKELTRANHVISNFIGTLSHELNTPLTSLIAFTDILRKNKEGNLTTTQKQHLEAMNRSGTQLNWLISQLLDATRIEAGTLELDLVRFDIADVIREAVDCYSPTLIDKKQSLGIHGFDESHCVEGDRARLVQVLTNLISNASKYSPIGAHIAISIESKKCCLRILVKDNGPGISDGDQNKLFEAFYRADNQLTRSESGTGLGLSIVKSLVEAHGGETWITSPLGGGTEVGFSLPIRSVPAADEQVRCCESVEDEVGSNKPSSSSDPVR